MRELSLRPYSGRLFLATSKKDYEAAYKKLFKTDDLLHKGTEGRFNGGEGKDGMWTYIVYAEHPHTLAHELSHVVLHVFERVGINPIDALGEPFCYMLSQLMKDAK